MLTYMITVSDNGELKSVSAAEFEAAFKEILPETGMRLAGKVGVDLATALVEQVLNIILDRRAIAADEYDPSDNDTPIIPIMGNFETPEIVND